jgi:hypothetical protein
MGRGTLSFLRWRTGARRWSYSSGPPIRGSVSLVLCSCLSLAEPGQILPGQIRLLTLRLQLFLNWKPSESLEETFLTDLYVMILHLLVT